MNFRFSILVSVYEKTPLKFFKKMVKSLHQQTERHFEVCLLSHGPMEKSLFEYIQSLPGDRWVHEHLDENIGIIGAMRHCLDRARGHFVVPIDADDFLAPRALECLGNMLSGHCGQYAYSDEYVYAGPFKQTCFARPDWDPVLGVASSYIWHLTAFDRKKALDLGVYSCRQSEYCHDWDTLLRFHRSGAEILHCRKPLYYWRQHEDSTTNSNGEQNPKSLDSQKATLHRYLDGTGLKSTHVAEVPYSRGVSEFQIQLKEVPRSLFSQATYGLEDYSFCNAVEEGDYVVFAPREHQLNEDCYQELSSLFALHSDYGVITGRTVDLSGRVLSSPIYQTKENSLIHPQVGRSIHDMGAFAIFAKPHSIDWPNPYLMAVRKEMILGASSMKSVWSKVSVYIQAGGKSAFAPSFVSKAKNIPVSVPFEIKRRSKVHFYGLLDSNF